MRKDESPWSLEALMLREHDNANMGSGDDRNLKRRVLRAARGMYLVALVALIVLPGTVAATDYRVSTPAEISAAMTSARPGDTLTMTNRIWMDAAIVFKGIGAKSSPYLLRAESYGGVILSGSSNLRITGRHLIVDGLLFRNGSSPSGDVIEFRGTGGESDSCRLTNCAIINYSPFDSTKDNKWVSLYGTSNRVDHCYFEGKKNSGATLVVWLSARPNYHQIDHNHFAYRPELYGWNGGETIRVGTSDWSMYDSYTIVEYNLFEQCNGEIETISNKSCGNIYRYNTFLSCQGTLTLRHGNRCTVEGNFFIANHVPNSGGIRIIGEDHKVFNNYVAGTSGSSLKSALTLMNGVPNSPLNRYFQVKRAIVAYNTFVDNMYSVNIGGGRDSELSLPPLDCVIANNVVSGSRSPLITVNDTPINMTWQGNVFYGATLGMAQPQGITMVSPQLALTTEGMWRPAASSPVVNAGTGAFPFVLMDMDGQQRDGQPDIGADELTATPGERRPLTRKDVGPPPQLLTSIRSRENEQTETASGIRLFSNYPNPFNPTTAISYQLSAHSSVSLRVFDVLGREVVTLVDGQRRPGMYQTSFDATSLNTGTYFLELRSNGYRAVQKMVYAK